MSRPTGEEIRQAKKFLLNKNIKTQIVKPNLFATAARELNKNFNDTLDVIRKAVKDAETNGSNSRRNKKA